MAVATFTKTGTKATTPAKLDKSVFGIEVKNHQMLKDAYLTYLANGRSAAAKTKKRGEVSGGGRKPWQQKGTGRARFGSSRNPIWRGGGIAFGPTGDQNYVRKMTLKSKHLALRQALSLAASEDRLKIVESFDVASGKVKPTLDLLNKLGATKNVLIVVPEKDALVERATRNLQNVKAVAANYLNVFDLLNADSIIVSAKALDGLSTWLGESAAKPKEVTNE